jgi:RND family efflux transporter MFP subunit
VSETVHAPPPRTTRRLALAGALALLAAIAAAALLFLLRHHRVASEADRRRRDVDRGPRVFVAEARLQPMLRELTLPADVRGFQQATVYAKISGYVKAMRVDKGDRVRAGQVLGVLESPEVDQQVAAAAADLAVKKRTFQRYGALVKKDFVSAQDFETVRAQYEVSRSALSQARAMQDYETLRAPFDGVVTARYVDAGALVPAATGSTQAALPLVDVADLRRLRVLAFIQQDATPYVHAGDGVTIAADHQPDVRIEAKVARCAGALDPRTRTMLCEVWLDGEHRLYPGTFVHMTFRLQSPRTPVIDSSALILREDKPTVAVVRDGRVRFVRVRPGLDDGKTVQILEGLRAGERVALSPPSELADGDPVRPVDQPKSGGGGSHPEGGPGSRRGASRE